MAARRSKAASGSERPSISPSPPSEGGGYASSVHIGGADPPGPWLADGLYYDVEAFAPVLLPAIADDALTRVTHDQLKKRRDRRAMDASLVRMQGFAKGG